MPQITIQLSETNGLTRVNEPVRVGVPISKGALFDIQGLTLTTENSPLPCQFNILNKWPDGSIRWLLCIFQCSVPANGKVAVTLEKAAGQLQTYPDLSIEKNNGLISVNTGGRVFRIHARELSWESANDSSDPASCHSSIELEREGNNTCTALLDDSWQIVESGPVSVIAQATGSWRDGAENIVALFDVRLSFYRSNALVAADVTIHNPKRAAHPGGLWDLGDPGSVTFRSLTIKTSAFDEYTLFTGESHAPIKASNESTLRLYQDSSGGDTWDSTNHINGDEQLTVAFQGYRVVHDDNTVADGLRSSPLLEGKSGDVTVSLTLSRFWQNFPSSLEVENGTLTAGLFPKWTRYPHELQGGERKSQTCYLFYGADHESLAWTHCPLTPVIPGEYYVKASVFPWFKVGNTETQLDELISKGLSGKHNFFAKREVIDEYGWRNFGDIFADHETLYQKPGEEPLISHYNNQYDAIYGFAKQFALTGDPRWFELMNDLAHHVTDIDIYHCCEDRAEYNNGLFWHTDHYLDARTATHRTFTKHHDISSTPGQTGGGPGPEHCYSVGLAYHYFMTGDHASKLAVLELANWMVSLHEGEGGLLEQVFAVKSKELPRIKAKLKGTKTTPHTYPFTRGTGNYINTLLDAWRVSQDKTWIRRCESIIKDCIHPADDINERDLLNTEISWSYLILLAAIEKYLTTKLELNEIDGEFQYALDSFCTYTRWMAANERPFLSIPKSLEFANDTWTAQDIRKAILLYQAIHFDLENKALYLGKANEWLDYVVEKLNKSPEAHYARILIILMQNHGPQDFANDTNVFPANIKVGLEKYDLKHPPTLTWQKLLKRIGRRLLKGLVTFNPSKEKAWLDARLNKL